MPRTLYSDTQFYNLHAHDTVPKKCKGGKHDLRKSNYLRHLSKERGCNIPYRCTYGREGDMYVLILEGI